MLASCCLQRAEIRSFSCLMRSCASFSCSSDVSICSRLRSLARSMSVSESAAGRVSALLRLVGSLTLPFLPVPSVVVVRTAPRSCARPLLISCTPSWRSVLPCSTFSLPCPSLTPPAKGVLALIGLLKLISLMVVSPVFLFHIWLMILFPYFIFLSSARGWRWPCR